MNYDRLEEMDARLRELDSDVRVLESNLTHAMIALSENTESLKALTRVMYEYQGMLKLARLLWIVAGAAGALVTEWVRNHWR